ncbi:hypothetical protein ACFY0F_37580 [Streptomyces sp. NPDC001544]|uniref:hypothetical protein n=1 Tax=Streptomyces sp. NPDC001544 TaxID=3364584 RepID=UPI0036966FB9
MVVIAAVATSCSTEEPSRDFSVPENLCGLSVPTDALSRLLPASGKILTTGKVDGSRDDDLLCKVTVDGDMVLTLSREHIDAGDSARHILLRQLSIGKQKSAERGTIAYAESAAVSLLQCRGSGVEKEDISTLVKVLEPARPNESAMRSLISGYTAALKKTGPCSRRPPA